MTHINGEQVWVLGAQDQAERRAVVTKVGNDRSTETISNFVTDYINTVDNQADPTTRTRVYHDEWRGYEFLQRPDSLYEGFTVVHHGGHFGPDIFSTNRIEGFWADLRRETNFQRGRHFQDLRDVQIELDVGNWHIKNRQNIHANFANTLFLLTERGGGIGANIYNLEEFGDDLDADDVNDNFPFP